jgi:hypothetical protein
LFASHNAGNKFLKKLFLSDLSEYTLATLATNLINLVFVGSGLLIVLYVNSLKVDDLESHADVILTGYLAGPCVIFINFVTVSYMQSRALRKAIVSELKDFRDRVSGIIDCVE